jgi:hypothetical protein
MYSASPPSAYLRARSICVSVSSRNGSESANVAWLLVMSSLHFLYRAMKSPMLATVARQLNRRGACR